MTSNPGSRVHDLAAARKRRERDARGEGCVHRDVVVYRDSRRVCCAICGAELDPFDVLVTVVEAQPPARGRRKRLLEDELE